MTLHSDTPPTLGRWDLYGPVHKGLRHSHMEMLQRLGRADFTRDVPALLADLGERLRLAALHLEDEERFIHSAIEARAPGGAAAVEGQHRDHHAHLSDLRAAMDRLKSAAPETAAYLGRELYLLYSRFVADDLAHMAHEEEVVWPQLCALFSDAELMDIEMQIVGSFPPEDMIAFMKIMLPALNRNELAGLLGGIKHNAPPEVHAAIIAAAARPSLPADDMAFLENAGLA